MTESTTQLELFEALPPASQRPRPAFQIGMLSLRYDHLVLVLLMGLVASSIVFAVGVERGKRLARLEHTPLGEPKAASPASGATKNTQSAAAPSTKDAPSTEDAESGSSAAKPDVPAKISPARPRKTPVKVADDTAVKFAIQVVTFRQPTRAQQELQRLQHHGERAFLMKKSDRVAVLVGPFPSKAHAASKLANLKPRYQDCFVKSL